MHGNIFGQIGIRAAHPRVGRAFNVRVEMHHLHQRVNARIGASGAQGADGAVGESAQCGFELILHRLTIGLALPTAIGLTVVTNT